MHVRWRGLELPAQVILEERSKTETFGRFSVEPFERGFGTTVGNSLRRILLSSIEGAAVVSAKIEGVAHEFSTLPGVQEDVVDIILNIKGLIVSLDSDEPKTMRLAATGPGDVTADLIEADTAVTIHNPDHIVATLTDEVDFEAELKIAKGRGYKPASEQYAERDEDLPVFEIAKVDADLVRWRRELLVRRWQRGAAGIVFPTAAGSDDGDCRPDRYGKDHSGQIDQPHL